MFTDNKGIAEFNNVVKKHWNDIPIPPKLELPLRWDIL